MDRDNSDPPGKTVYGTIQCTSDSRNCIDFFYKSRLQKIRYSVFIKSIPVTVIDEVMAYSLSGYRLIRNLIVGR